MCFWIYFHSFYQYSFLGSTMWMHKRKKKTHTDENQLKCHFPNPLGVSHPGRLPAVPSRMLFTQISDCPGGKMVTFMFTHSAPKASPWESLESQCMHTGGFGFFQGAAALGYEHDVFILLQNCSFCQSLKIGVFNIQSSICKMWSQVAVIRKQ